MVELARLRAEQAPPLQFIVRQRRISLRLKIPKQEHNNIDNFVLKLRALRDFVVQIRLLKQKIAKHLFEQGIAQRATAGHSDFLIPSDFDILNS